MVFYVIGNGFDRHYGLQTSYESFKTYLDAVNHDVVKRIDDLFYRYNMSNAQKDIDEWNTLEDMLAVFCYLDGGEIYEEALSNAETDDERADFFDSPAWNVGFLYTKVTDRQLGEYTYYSGKVLADNGQEKLYEKTFKLYIKENGSILQDVCGNRYYELIEGE